MEANREKDCGGRSRPFQRRTFLLTSALASAGVLLGLKRCALADPSDQRVVVIGAGMAGLAAASRLHAQGYSVVVLEGRNRVGGRIHTDRSMGSPVDLGAAWIEGTQGNPIGDLRQQYGVAAAATDYDAVALHDDDGSPYQDSVAEGHDQFAEQTFRQAQQYSEGLESDVSVQAAVNHVLAGQQLSAQRRRYMDFRLSDLEMEMAAKASQLSSWWHDEGKEFSGDDLLVYSGYDQIPNRLAEGLDLRLGCRVQQVRMESHGIRVTTDKGDLEGAVCLVTLPLGVLKSGTVAFQPGLPQSKRDAMARLGMGQVEKVVLKFAAPFWPQAAHFVAFTSANPGEFPAFLSLMPYSSQPILVGFVAGAFLDGLKSKADAAIAADATAVLRKLYGSSVPAPTAFKITDWHKQPESLGAYSYLPVGASPNDRDALAAPVENRLFFAGEATHKDYPATVHGAYLSGIREADRIAQVLGPPNRQPVIDSAPRANPNPVSLR